jgi:anti-sigma factor RsiW
VNPQLSHRDLEQISAYMDGSLDPRASAQLAQRVNTEPEFARALKRFEATRALLRHAPQRRVPRPFTLTLQMLGQAAPRRSRTRYSLVSAVASLLLVFTILGDFSINGLPVSFGAPAPAADAAAETFMMQEAPSEGGVAEEPEPAGEPQAEDLANADRMAKAPFDPRAFFAQNARPIEFGLALTALVAGVLAWLNKRKG